MWKRVENVSKRFVSAMVFFLMVTWSLRIMCRIRRHYRRSKRTTNTNRISSSSSSQYNRVLLSFSGAGFRGFYFQGVCAYLQDQFDLSNVDFAGVSAGASTSSALALDLPVEASLLFALRWFQLTRNLPLGFYFVPTRMFLKVLEDVCDEFGITDAHFLSLFVNCVSNQDKQITPSQIVTTVKKEDSVTTNRKHYFGVTNVSTFPWRHEVISNSDLKTRRELLYVLSCSMRVVPFFRNIGWFRGKYMIDGGFSRTFCIPTEIPENRIVRITPDSSAYADICPDAYDSNNYCGWFYTFVFPDLKLIRKQFEQGYIDAIRRQDRLIAKGLKLKSPNERKYRLHEWLDYIDKEGADIYENDDCSKKDRSGFWNRDKSKSDSLIEYTNK